MCDFVVFAKLSLSFFSCGDLYFAMDAHCSSMSVDVLGREERIQRALDAASRNDGQLVVQLLCADIDVDDLLFHAVDVGAHESFECFQTLGANFNACNGFGATVLAYACLRREMLCAEMIVRFGGCVDEIGMDFETPLSTLASAPDLYLSEMSFLIQNGASLNRASPASFTPLFSSLLAGKIEEANLLVLNGAFDDDYFECQSVLSSAIQQGMPVPLLSRLFAGGCALDSGVFMGETALFYAVRHQDYRYGESVVAALIEHGCDVNVRSHGSFTPLLQAVQCGRGRIARQLLESGASVDTTGVTYTSPFLAAIATNDVDLAMTFIHARCDILGRRHTYRLPDFEASLSCLFDTQYNPGGADVLSSVFVSSGECTTMPRNVGCPSRVLVEWDQSFRDRSLQNLARLAIRDVLYSTSSENFITRVLRLPITEVMKAYLCYATRWPM